MKAPLAHPMNVPGDFYVEDGCCTSCNMPFTEAPELFGSADGELDGHCFVRKQPESTAELSRMLMAMAVSDLGCTRYKGKNRTIQIRLVEAGEGPQCDFLDEQLQERTKTIAAHRAAANATLESKEK